MLRKKLHFLPILACFVQVKCIVSKPNISALEKKDFLSHDNTVAQSVDRDYVSGFEENYGHGGHGLSAHASYGFSEGYEGHGELENIKHHNHHYADHHHHHHHNHPKHYDYHKALAIKGLLVPLAGVALLGAAAAFVSNPVLLQLGVISGATIGRKKREAIISADNQNRLNEIRLLETFMAQVPEHELEAQEKKMLANYFSCNGAKTTSPCLERLACELHSPEGISMPMETKVLTIIVNDILSNDFIQKEEKKKIVDAVQKGKSNLSCGTYKCDILDQPTSETTGKLSVKQV